MLKKTSNKKTTKVNQPKSQKSTPSKFPRQTSKQRSEKDLKSQTKKEVDQLGRVATCNQCGLNMEGSVDIGIGAISACDNPKCPNFALLQISMEKMAEYLKTKK